MPSRARHPEVGQALPLMLVAVAVVLTGVLVLTAFGQALGGRSRLQRGTDLAAVSAARTMRADYPRLFEPAVVPNGARNPHHLSTAAYLARARSAAVDGGRRNGVRIAASEVDFPGAGFAPTRVRVRASGEVRVRVDGAGSRRRRRVPVRGHAVAELAPTAGLGLPAFASGGGYTGPLAYRQGKPMPHLFSAL